jgi:hypothetical protein
LSDAPRLLKFKGTEKSQTVLVGPLGNPRGSYCGCLEIISVELIHGTFFPSWDHIPSRVKKEGPKVRQTQWQPRGEDHTGVQGSWKAKVPRALAQTNQNDPTPTSEP